MYRLSGVKADYKAIDDAHTCCDMSERYMIEGDTIIDKIRNVYTNNQIKNIVLIFRVLNYKNVSSEKKIEQTKEEDL